MSSIHSVRLTTKGSPQSIWLFWIIAIWKNQWKCKPWEHASSWQFSFLWESMFSRSERGRSGEKGGSRNSGVWLARTPSTRLSVVHQETNHSPRVGTVYSFDILFKWISHQFYFIRKYSLLYESSVIAAGWVRVAITPLKVIPWFCFVTTYDLVSLWLQRREPSSFSSYGALCKT